MKRLLLYSILVFAQLCAFAKTTSGECPPWVNGDYPPKSNDTYYFMVTDGTGKTLNEARADADLGIVGSLMRAAGVTVSGSQIERMLHEERGTEIDERVTSQYEYNFELDRVHMAFKAVDTYWVKNGNTYNCKVLYEVAENPSRVTYDPVEYTTKYGARGLWRSMIIPGWGQMYKKSYAKGVIILALEAGALSTALVFNNQHSSYINKSKATTDPAAIKFYQNKANKARNMSSAFFIGAGAIYIYNIVDAIMAKGKMRYVKPNGQGFSFSPYFDPQTNFGLSIAYTF